MMGKIESWLEDDINLLYNNCQKSKDYQKF